jgi:hypothetical protein
VVIAIVNSLSTIAFHIALSPADLRGIAIRDRGETVCESAAVVEWSDMLKSPEGVQISE